MALGSGGLFGAGLGTGRQKFLWLPNAYTDSIFAVLGEELGLVGATMVLLLFLALGWRGARVASHAPDGFGRLIAAGTTIYVVSQALINIAVISNLVPFTGIPLPLISYGGTSLSVTLTGLGLLLNVSRQQVADPQVLLTEELRNEERRKRELLREQRMADRERAAAQRKLLEAEQVGKERLTEKERFDLAGAFRRWQENREQPRLEQPRVSEVPPGKIQKVERLFEPVEEKLEVSRTSEVLQKRRENLQRTVASWKEQAQEASKWRQAQEAARAKLRPQPKPVVPDEPYEPEIALEEMVATPEQRDLPPVATQSYLSFKTGIEREVKLSAPDYNKPKLQKPRRDWAKMYEARRNRKD
jgi:hypothetical protein